MKELTIEQKAKCYDEALERAKGVIEQNPLMEYLKKGIEYIFPELKESEDEKIKGAIIHFISHTPTVPKGIIGKKTMLAWLEKQGDKPQGKSVLEAIKEETDVEFVSKDAFIENALKWYCLDCECNDNCNADYKCFFRQEYKRYLEGNNNAIPPKFDNAINLDGSVTENYRYRHFIRKVRDAFVEKACDWMDEHCKLLTSKDYEDFRKYMKGE